MLQDKMEEQWKSKKATLWILLLNYPVNSRLEVTTSNRKQV